jgi:pSer/pThr/pTyr-binding forkhead associated (FHA) protein
MMTYLCPKGHASTEPDYCSDCGTRIQGEPSAATIAPPPSPTATQSCPDCGTPHEIGSGKFCEICGYNFVTGAHGEIPLTTPPPPAEDSAVESSGKSVAEPALTADTVKQADASPISVSQGQWQVTIAISPTRHHPDSPEPPLNQPPMTLLLQQDSTLIGRTSDKRAIYPDIALDFDDAVSHRHALLIKQSDGHLMVRDIGSSNGTKLNGTELATMTDTLINDGDELTLGHWTTIQFKQI